MKFLKSFLRSRRGAVMVEYALLVAGVSVVAITAVSVIGHKTSDLLGMAAAIIPGVNEEDNQSISSGELIEVNTVGPDDSLAVDVETIVANASTERLGNNVGYDPGQLPLLVIHPAD